MLKTSSMDSVCMGCFGELNSPKDECPACGYNEAAQTGKPHHLRPRTILSGKYLLGRVLGEGGFGITYIGWDLNLDIKVAIKEYYPSGFVTRETTVTSTVQPFTGSQGDFFLKGRERFIDEARSLAKFRSMPGIVSVSDFFMENGTAYIVMEYIDGQTFKAYLSQMDGRLPAAQVFDMLCPVMSSLAVVHRSGMIHRDISPDNIMISREGYVKLLDFGAAREFADSGNKSLSVMLKLGYAPEEQYRSRGKQGPWTDIYALSATMYNAMTGVTPDEANERILRDEVRRPSELGFVIDPGQEAALMRGMAVLAENRFQSIEEFLSALYPADAGVTVPAIPQPVPMPQVPAGAAAPVVPGPGSGPVSAPGSPAVMQQPQQGGQAFAFFSLIKTKKWIPIVSGAAVVALALLIIFLSKNSGGAQGDITPDMNSPAQEQTQSPALNTPSVPGMTDRDAGQPVNTYGNTTGNIVNGGLVAQQGDWLYYRSNDEGSLYKMRMDGAERTKLCDDSVAYISVVGDWVYYRNVSDMGMLYKIRTDGTGRIKLCEDGTTFINVTDGWIYYLNADDDYRIYKIRTDGGERTMLSDETNCTHIIVRDGWVYYSRAEFQDPEMNETDNISLNRIRTDGTAPTRLSDTIIIFYNVIDGWIYYSNIDDGYKPYKMRVDGTGITMLSDDQSRDINVVDGWIYFNNRDDDFKLYKIREDGTESMKLCDIAVTSVNVAGDWVYFYESDDEDYRLYRVRTDGTGLEFFDESYAETGEEIGNTASNILCHSQVVEKGGWIYFCNQDGNYCLYKVRADGTEKTRVNSRSSGDYNVVGDWAYYTNGDGYLFRIRTDGTGEELIIMEHVSNITVTEDAIFYLGMFDNFIYRANTDGTGRQVICGESCLTPTYYDGFIYYVNASDSNKLYRVRTDGVGNEKIFDVAMNDIALVDGWVYFRNMDDAGNLYRHLLYGTEQQKITDEEVFHPNVYDGWVYYSNIDDNRSLYKIRIDGTDRQKLNSEKSDWINVTREWVYFFSWDEMGFYRMRKDGSDCQLAI